MSGHDVANGRTDRRTVGQTDGRTDGRHTIIRPKFYFGRIKKSFKHMVIKTLASWTKSLFWNKNFSFLAISSIRETRIFFNN